MNSALTKLTKQMPKDKPNPVKIDWSGISQRLWQVPIDSGNYSELRAVDGRLICARPSDG